MIFNSYLFVLVFLPLTVILYFLINSTNYKYGGRLFLLFVSLCFYCINDCKSLPVFLVLLSVNFLMGSCLFNRIKSIPLKKAILILGIVFNLLSLGYFKYLGFFEGLINNAFLTNFTYSQTLLPLGISYITFSEIAYLINSYRKSSESPSRPTFEDFLNYSLFITFFPKITVGPIAFDTDLIPQFGDETLRKVNYDNISKGLIAFTIGLSKKVLLADNLSNITNWGYSNISSLGTTNAFIVMVAYTMQIYFDFSGYCDMAKGICLMLNIELIDNFNSPYCALSVDDFWKKWHISLTRFFRNYVYIPMGGNRKGILRTYLNMFIVFFLSGLWHGAALTFIVWGMLHGIGIIISKALSKITEKIPKIIRFLYTFLFVNLTWVIFRANDLKMAMDYYRELFSFKMLPVDIKLVADATPDEMQFFQWMILTTTNSTPYISGCIIMISLLLISVIISLVCKNTTKRLTNIQYNKRCILTIVIMLVWSILSLSKVTEFIYTNF